ncbi:Conserved oligomeric Golgi complex subunit 1 [Gryllus bimaculatus]|nr:Conserved oligomeric Golgi complex subunit 1 [Gryllus bimaculatus]
MPVQRLLDINPDKLFEQHTISEIQDINKKLQAEIERKREELRTMVGERYRDMIEAADTIRDMQTTAESVITHIDRMREKCCELQQKHLLGFKLDMQHIKTERFSKHKAHHSLAIQIKILTILPEEIWSAEASNCLCSIVLLEGLTPLELLNKILSLRTQALKSTLLSDQHVSVKTRICNSLRLLVHTISMLYACFVDGCPEATLPEGMVWKQLKNIVGRDAPSSMTLIDIEDEVGIKFLPPHVREYRPSTQDQVEPVAPSAMRESLNKWLDWVQEFTRSQAKKLLQLVNSLKSLQSIRAEANSNVKIPENWDNMCQKLLIPKGLDLWNNYFQPLLTARAKELVSIQWNSALDDSCFLTLKSSVADITSERCIQPEHDLRWFIWKEQASDLPQSDGNGGFKPTARGLLMKAKGYSPCIEKLCAKFDSLLQAILNDVYYYVGGKQDSTIILKSEKFSDSDDLQEHLKIASGQGLQRLMDFVLSVCNEVNDEPMKKEACLLLMARFLQGLCDLCPNLQKCLAPNNPHKEGSIWQTVCALLRQKSVEIWRMWQAAVTSKFKDMIATNLTHGMWDVTSIEEEGEEGYRVKSDIRVPSQPSLPLQSLLNLVCHKLNAVAPHTLPRKIHQDLIEQLVSDIFESYDSASQKDGLGQPQALQYLLDALVGRCQEICDKFEDKIDPFDLDVFCPYIQNNIKRSVQRTQGLLGILIAWPDKLAVVSGLRPPSTHTVEDPSVLPLCSNAPWFPLLPVTGPPGSRLPPATQPQTIERPQLKKTSNVKTKVDPTPGDIVRSGAAALFGVMSSDWFGSGS